jgi:hypothetical protein
MLPSKNLLLFHWFMIILPHPLVKNHFIGQFMIKKQKALYQWTIILPIHWIPSANDVILPYFTYLKNSFMWVKLYAISMFTIPQSAALYL